MYSIYSYYLLDLVLSFDHNWPLWLVMWNSYVIVNPNEAVVTQFFGRYVSTLKIEGFRFFINPLYSKSKISFLRSITSNLAN